jgi:hypothetical protein
MLRVRQTPNPETEPFTLGSPMPKVKSVPSSVAFDRKSCRALQERVQGASSDLLRHWDGRPYLDDVRQVLMAQEGRCQPVRALPVSRPPNVAMAACKPAPAAGSWRWGRCGIPASMAHLIAAASRPTVDHRDPTLTTGPSVG